MTTKEEARSLILWLGITPNVKGFNYIVDGICLVAEDLKIKRMSVYEEVGKIYNEKPQKVERAIRHCVTKLFEKPDTANDVRCIFGLSEHKDKLSNSEFLWLCADYILNKR